MSAPARRELVRQMIDQELSERRSLAVAGMSASAYRYAPRPDRKPNQNAYIESFNGRLRDECLNEHWFSGLLYVLGREIAMLKAT